MEWRGILWYVSPFFWAVVFIFMLSKVTKSRLSFNFALAIVVYCGFVFNMQATHGHFDRQMAFGVICLGLWRALALIGVGVFLSELVEYVEMAKITRVGILPFYVKLIFWTLAEGASYWVLFLCLLKGGGPKNVTVLIVAFCVIVFSCLTKSGLFARILNCRPLGVLGRYSYSIYVFQVVAFRLMSLYLWPRTAIVSNYYACMSLSCLLTVLVGGMCYYLIEKPGARIMKKLPCWVL